MTYLIDTNVLLWSMGDSSRLTPKATAAIIDSKHEIHVSIASIWEIAIKLSIGKLDLTKTLDEIIAEMDALAFSLKPVSLDALRLVRNMPFHHRDPFDRLIIAQAQAEGIPVITKDEKFELYPIRVIWQVIFLRKYRG